MSLSMTADPVPLRVDADGVARVGHTRVTLDTVVACFGEGATAEEIVLQYPSLDLGDVYALIAYYLKRTAAVESYLHVRERNSAAVRQRNEARCDPSGVRN